MRVDVLNGVNLDVLERRDPALYGGLSLRELEQKIDSWAEQLGHTVRCRQTNSEGEYVDFCHDSLDWAEGVIVNPGAWTHYSYAIRDALEIFPGPIVEVHCSCPGEVALDRYQSRTRHPCHFDLTYGVDIFDTWMRTDAGPLALGGPLFVVDTTRPVDVDEIAEWVSTHI